MPEIRDLLDAAVGAATPVDIDAIRHRARQRRARRRLFQTGVVFTAVIALTAGLLAHNLAGDTSREPVAAGPGKITSGPVLPFWSLLSTGAPAFPSGALVSDVAKWNGRWYAGGSMFSPAVTVGLEPVVWSSADGTAWQRAWDLGRVNLGSATTVRFVATDAALLLFEVGTPGTRLWRTTDGTHWSQVGLPWEDGVLADLASGNGHYLAAVLGKGPPDQLWSSTDAVSWTAIAFDGGPHRFDAVAITPDGLLAGGADNPAIGRPTVWSSRSGTGWKATALTPDPGEVTALGQRGSRSLAAVTSYRVANGQTQDAGASLWYSSGAAWSRASVIGSAPSHATTIASLPSGVVALQATGDALAVSTDGVSWVGGAVPSGVDMISAIAVEDDAVYVLAQSSIGTDAWRLSLVPPSPMTTVPPPDAPVCRTEQLSVTMAGINAVGGGQWSAAYWVTNPSPTACRLPGSITVDLLAASGTRLRMLVHQQPAGHDVVLRAGPAKPGNPPPAGTTAYFDVFFTMRDMPGGGGDCPTPLVEPAAIRVTFGTTVGPVRIDGQGIAYCRDAVSVDGPAAIS
ncbi:MAG: hypothetical protein JWO37_2728 [Acidimicrobiales bacterium]|jgi:hypothetical protein|nr:hypothetical protein [Acidimicrobiales bacterium]